MNERDKAIRSAAISGKGADFSAFGSNSFTRMKIVASGIASPRRVYRASGLIDPNADLSRGIPDPGLGPYDEPSTLVEWP
jgi:hypothetical protein